MKVKEYERFPAMLCTPLQNFKTSKTALVSASFALELNCFYRLHFTVPVKKLQGSLIKLTELPKNNGFIFL